MKLNDQIQKAMDEVRTLVLGTQVLLGFKYQSVLQPQFVKLPFSDQVVGLVGIEFLLVNFAHRRALNSPAVSSDCHGFN